MAFGIKSRVLETSKGYTTEELFEAIKDKEFTAGKAELTKMGAVNMIVFPPLDRNNQLWLIPKQMKDCRKWEITKQGLAGVGNAVANIALNELSNGLFGLGGMFGEKNDRAEKLVDITLQELQTMGL